MSCGVIFPQVVCCQHDRPLSTLCPVFEGFFSIFGHLYLYLWVSSLHRGNVDQGGGHPVYLLYSHISPPSSSTSSHSFTHFAFCSTLPLSWQLRRSGRHPHPHRVYWRSWCRHAVPKKVPTSLGRLMHSLRPVVCQFWQLEQPLSTPNSRSSPSQRHRIPIIGGYGFPFSR